ncbi:sigma-70 family RNA polymerase sigma factor [Streptomyces zhihengii]|uniref:Sigma-70 family RNA polymerase sigma factor n=2 Tax=Streptomyces zhihengii TaxID=1818004 RepID=A0ABS2V3B5_9ACTN|nr:sigma-70 family RNA polymerase sigma factor [Streptomyces zhihengii]
MTPSLEPPAPAPEPAPVRPGRKLGPIMEGVGSVHRAWLEPLRAAYLGSGLTMSHLSVRVPLAKSKISELLRGLGHYPRWEIIFSLSVPLEVPSWPLYRLWRQAALEARKSPDWVEQSSDRIPVTTAQTPPLDHRAFQETVETMYRLYAQVFLDDDQRDTAVSNTFDILWLSWNDALASPDIRRFAWQALRATVMSRTPHIDGRPEFGAAAFDTIALRQLSTEAAQMHQMAESLQLFKAMSWLPEQQLDVMVMRRLYDFPPEEVSALLGVPLAIVRSSERHAIHFLENVICPPTETEGTTA